MLKKTTATLKKAELNPKWYIIDVKDKVLGRAASRVARLLLGKDKTTYSPNLPVGDFVIVVNAKNVAVSGNDEETKKKYYNYSGYPSGLRTRQLKVLRKEKPDDIIRHAVWGMMPKNKLGKELITRLYVYPSATHPHEAQKPVEVEV